MKICFLIWHYWPGHQGGSERQCRLIAHGLAARGEACAVVTARTGWGLRREEPDAGVRVVRLGLLIPLWTAIQEVLAALVTALWPARAGLADMTAAGARERRQRALLFWLQLPWVWLARAEFIACLFARAHRGDLRADVVHLHEPSWLGGVAVWVAPRLGAAVLCQEAMDPPMPDIGYDTPFRKRLDRLRRRPLYVAMTASMASGLVQRGIPEACIRRLNNAVQIPSHVAPVARNRDVLYVGNLSQGAVWKAFDVLIDAWARVAAAVPASQLVVVGGGDPALWRQLAQTHGCLDRIRFVGRVSDPSPHYQQAALLVLPSRVEGMSNALLEAQSWGLPVVASHIPGNAAVVTHGENGLLAPVGDAPALAEAIVQLLRDPPLRERLGNRARQRMESAFSPEMVLSGLLPVYHAALADLATPPATSP